MMSRLPSPDFFRRLWAHYDVDRAKREQMVILVEDLEQAGCSRETALRTALDEWLQGQLDQDEANGIVGMYLGGPHWDRIKILSTLLAGGRCEGWVCRSTADLQRHHIDYGSVGWESLFDVSVLCDECHRRLTYGDSFYERELEERRAGEKEARDRALRLAQRQGKRVPRRRAPRQNVQMVDRLKVRAPRSSFLSIYRVDDIPF
jgi:hypothetical protein